MAQPFELPEQSISYGMIFVNPTTTPAAQLVFDHLLSWPQLDLTIAQNDAGSGILNARVLRVATDTSLTLSLRAYVV